MLFLRRADDLGCRRQRSCFHNDVPTISSDWISVGFIGEWNVAVGYLCLFRVRRDMRGSSYIITDVRVIPYVSHQTRRAAGMCVFMFSVMPISESSSVKILSGWISASDMTHGVGCS